MSSETDHVQSAYRRMCETCEEVISMAFPYCPWCKSATADYDRGRPRITDEALIDEMHRLYDEFDRVTSTIMAQHGRYAHTTYTSPQHFGSWNGALDAAGLPKNATQFSETELIEDYQRVADTLGRVPSSADLDEHGVASPTTYYNRLGRSTELAEKYLDIPQPNSR